MLPERKAFPLAWLDPRKRISVSHRIGACAEFFLSRWPVCPLQGKEPASFGYLTMAGRNHALLLRESLLSLHRTWSKLPPLTIVSDGSWNAGEIREVLSWWPEKIVCLEPQDILNSLSAEVRFPLEKLATAHPLGLKLASIASESLKNRFVFIDSDVLFFKDPLPWLEIHDWNRSPAASVEPTGTFHRSLAEAIFPETLQPPFVNSGFLLIGHPLTASSLWPLLLEEAVKKPGEEFNEQTIIACLARHEGQVLSSERFLNRFDDATSLLPKTRQGDARHYVRFLRHLLYKDALFLRLQAKLRGHS